jgi:hypothetical protein
MTTLAAKARLFAPLVLTRPTEALDRVLGTLQERLERRVPHPGHYEPTDLATLVESIGAALDRPVTSYLAEDALSEIERRVLEGIRDLSTEGPFSTIHNADLDLARLCYATCRALEPSVVVETGVGYGVTTAFLLQALDVNGRGKLHSIDLPPLAPDADRFVGALVPSELRRGWRMHRGASRRVLPAVVRSGGEIGLFLHDSLHTYRHMRWEFDAVLPHLTAPGAILSDDIDGNSAFQELAAVTGPAFAGTAREPRKSRLLGAAIYR